MPICGFGDTGHRQGHSWTLAQPDTVTTRHKYIWAQGPHWVPPSFAQLLPPNASFKEKISCSFGRKLELFYCQTGSDPQDPWGSSSLDGRGILGKGAWEYLRSFNQGQRTRRQT